MPGRPRSGLVIVVASLPMFMVSLNNLVVTNALPEIARDFFASEANLQWVVNGYILAFAGLLLTGAALGDRFGRRRVFFGGIVLFALGSIACALAPSVGFLILARVAQGAGAAAVQPLSLTLVTSAVPESKRSTAIGLWGGVNGLGVAIGPLIGGAVTQGLSWQWIFWINVPVALAALPLLLRFVPESSGRDRELDLFGMLLVSAAVTFAVAGIVRAAADGWSATPIVGIFCAVAALLVLFVLWERRSAAPLLPLRFYRERAFVLSNIVSLAMFFGVFGSIFFISQYLQGPLDFSAFGAGVRTLPWTAMPMLVAPVAGALTDRVGGGRLMALGLIFQGAALAWLAAIATIDLSYATMVPALVLAGLGMGLVFAPTMIVVLGSVQDHEHGKASGANNTVREVGGALGVAVLTTVFESRYHNAHIVNAVQGAQVFVRGMVSAIWVGVAVVAVGALAALFIPRRPRPLALSGAPVDSSASALDEAVR